MKAFEVIFWISTGLVVWVYIGYPIYLLISTRFRRPPVKKSECHPSVSVITTVYNEQNHMRKKVENCLNLDYPEKSIEFVFVSDGSTDNTANLLGEATDERIRLLANSDRRGKDFAQSDGVENAKGEILVFTDAQTMLARDAILEMMQYFADPTVGCVSGYDIADDDGTGSGEGAYVRYEMKLRKLESATKSTVVVSGCFFGIRSELCRNWHPGLTSDFYLPIIALQNNFRVVLAHEAKASYRVSAEPEQEFRRKVRTVVNGLDVLSNFKSILNPFKYGAVAFAMLSHKLLRWVVPWALIAAVISNIVLIGLHPFYDLAIVVQLALYVLALLGSILPNLRAVTLIRVPFFFVMANLSILVAWFYFLRGASVTIWNPTER